MGDSKLARSVGVHDGSFHADEVTACALLALFNLIDEDKIVRTRDPQKLQLCEYVCDVGGEYDPLKKHFDHHQADYHGSYSSAGMILAYLRDQKIINEKEYNFFNQSLIIGVDDHDNGRAPQINGYCFFSNVISNYTPISYETNEEEENATFHEAFNFVLGHLKRMLERFHYNQQCRGIVDESMKKNKDCLMFDRAISWQDSFFELGGKGHPAKFVIMPTRGHWKLRAIPPDPEHRMDVRLPLPKAWAGLSDEDLVTASKIPGAIFCHKGRFVSVWKTREDALRALEIALKDEG